MTAIDSDPRYLEQARWARALLGLEREVEIEQAAVWDLARRGERFDLVLCLGLFYHLRHPLLALEMVAEKVERLLVFQSLVLPDPVPSRERAPPGEDGISGAGGAALGGTAGDGGLGLELQRVTRPGWPAMAFVEHELMADATNWWVPNRACIEALLRHVGLEVVARPDDHTWLCAPDPSGASRRQRYRDELRTVLRPER